MFVVGNFSPLPNVSTLAVLVSPRKSSPDLQKPPELPGISRPTPVSAVWGPHFQRLGENEADMFGNGDAATLRNSLSNKFVTKKALLMLGQGCLRALFGRAIDFHLKWV